MQIARHPSQAKLRHFAGMLEMLRQRSLNWPRELAWSTAGMTALLGAWAVVTLLDFVPPEFLPDPWTVARRFFDVATSERFSGALLEGHALASIAKFGLSYVIAVVLGVPLGIAMGHYRALDWIVSPIFDAIRFIPPIGWVPFSILWFGTGLLAPTWIVFVAVFPPCVLNAYRGVHLVEVALKEAAQTMGASGYIVVKDVLLPGALPQIIAGMRIGAGLGWQSLVGAELIVGGTGLGYAMTQSQQSLDTSTLIVCMLTIGVVGAAIDYALTWTERRIRRNWSPA